MRVLEAVMVCVACTGGHGRRVQITGQGPTHQTRLSATTPRDSLSALLMVRGGQSGLHDLRDGYERRGRYGRRGGSRFDVRGGFVEGPPMTPSRSRRSRRALRTSGAVVDFEDMDSYTDIGGVSGNRVRRRGSVGRSIDKSDSVLVQGGSLKTWSFPSSIVDRVQVVLSTDGRPLDADVQLWQGPDNTPAKMRVYSEDGNARPFSAVIATPFGGDNTVAVRNVGQIEFPLDAEVTANDVDEPLADFRDTSIVVQGGALRTFNFDTTVESVEIMLKTDGRPLNARIEMLQGPNNNKQVIELYTEDGLERPFFAVIDTMGSGNVVRVVNTAPMEFPMTASVQPHSVNERMSLTDPVIGGGRSFN